MNTKNKSKKGIIGIALAAIMIASIFAVFTLPILSKPDECEPQPGALIVDIVTPEMNETFTECTHFYVNAVIANSRSDKLEAVNATIKISGNAELVEDGVWTGKDTDTKPLRDIVPNGVTDVWWELHCNGVGDVEIEVTANSLRPDVTNYSVVIVKQVADPEDPVLEVEIFQYPLDMVEECDVFGIKANITHIGRYDINTDVHAIINWTDWPSENLVNLVDGMPRSWNLGPMKKDDMHEVGWTMHCNGAGDVNITVDADFSGMKPGHVLSDTVTVEQKEPADLTLVIIEPANNTKICTECNDTFVVTALLNNTGDVEANGITAKISAVFGAGNVTMETPFTKSVPNIPGGGSETVSWNITCDSTGVTTFNVTATGYCGWTGTEMTPSDEVTIYQKEFIVEITTPAEGSTFSSCQNFEVIANITNCLDDEIAGFNVTLDFSDLGANFTDPTDPRVYITHKPKAGWADNVTMTRLAPGVYNVTFDESFCECCYAELKWYLECLNDTDGNITVNATKMPQGTPADDDSVYIEQEWKADLAAGIETFAGLLNIANPELDTFVPEITEAFAVCQNITVVVPVTNWGEADAENVSVIINVAGKAVPNGTLPAVVIGTIPGGESRKAIWELHCNGKGDVTIGILDGYLTGIDENTGVSVLADNIHIPCDRIITQTPFTVEIIEPTTCTNFLEGQQFTVKVNITNGGDETLENVSATIHIGGGTAVLVEPQPPMVSVGDLKPGKWIHAPTWQLKCTNPGDVWIDVSVTASTEEGTMYEIWSNTVNVHQKRPANVAVEILSPDPDCTFIATSTEFLVTATLKDCASCLDAVETYVVLSIHPSYSASVVSGNQYIGPFALNVSDGKKTLNWTLHCDKSINLGPCASTKIGVHVHGWDSAGKYFTNYNVHTYVYQYPAAHLEVAISEPDDGGRKVLNSEFNITATITNTGEADVWEGKATLSVVPENSLLLAKGGYTKEIGTLTGHEQDESKTVTWTVQCEELGKSTITVDVSGKDEFGYHLKQCIHQDDCPCECMECTYEPAMEPGRAIPEDHIEPASITVKQVTEEDLVEPFDDDITIVGTGWTFMSVPKKLVPAQDTFGELLDATLLVAGFRYDPATPPYWFSLTGSDPVEVLEGYWIYYSSADTITLSYLAGGQMVPPSKDLTGKAWNTIGFSSVTAKSASTTLKSVEGSWSTVIDWDETGQQYEGAIIYQVNDNGLMNPGEGYWLWMKDDDTVSALSA